MIADMYSRFTVSTIDFELVGLKFQFLPEDRVNLDFILYFVVDLNVRKSADMFLSPSSPYVVIKNVQVWDSGETAFVFKFIHVVYNCIHIT